jgi:hypothetical protein
LDLHDAREGLFFFRVTAPGHAYTGKALALSHKAEHGNPFASASTSATATRITALAKAATANLHALVITKSGYRPYTYRPRTDRDTGVVVRLAAEGDSGIQYAGIIRAKVVAIDTAAHAINYSYSETKCSGSSQTTVEQKSSLPFWIRDGKWYFPAGNCQGVALGKPTAGFFGSWKTLGVETYPAGLLPVTCDPGKDSVVTGVLNLFFINEGGGWDIDLREDSMTIKIRRELCPGNQAVYNVAYYDGLEGRPLLTKNTCREVEFRNPSNEPGTYSFVTQSDSLRGVFTYKDKTCPTPGVSLSIDTHSPKTCPETQPTSLAADTTFQRCVINTGFLPPKP